MREYVGVTQSEVCKVDIRLATDADVNQTAHLVMARAGRDLQHWVDRLRGEIAAEDSALWVAARTDQIVGYGRVGMFHRPAEASERTAPPGYYLGGLFVVDHLRRRGLGRKITRVRLEWIAARADTAWFFANARNEVSMRLHRELGFHEVTRDFEYPGVQFDGGVGVLCAAELKRSPGAPGSVSLHRSG